MRRGWSQSLSCRKILWRASKRIELVNKLRSPLLVARDNKIPEAWRKYDTLMGSNVDIDWYTINTTHRRCD